MESDFCPPEKWSVFGSHAKLVQVPSGSLKTFPTLAPHHSFRHSFFYFISFISVSSSFTFKPSFSSFFFYYRSQPEVEPFSFGFTEASYVILIISVHDRGVNGDLVLSIIDERLIVTIIKKQTQTNSIP